MKWPVLISLGTISFVLGYLGFANYAAVRGENPSFLDLVYQTLQLISMSSGLVPGPINWQLQLARFLIPTLTVYTALSAMALIFSEQMQVVKLLRIKNHVIICGLGRKGVLLAEQFLALDMEVVILEQDEGNDWLESTRGLGAVVLIGDAADSDLLHQAKVERAKFLIAVMGDDGINAEIALRAKELNQKRTTGVLTCLIHIVDPQLYDLLREKELQNTNPSGYRLELFNIYDRGARLILQSMTSPGDQSSLNRLLIIGMGKLGESVILHAIKQWHEKNVSNKERLQIKVIDRDAHEKAKSLCIRYPQFHQVCNLIPLQMEVTSPEFLRADFLHNQLNQPDVEGVFICLDNDSLGLQAGLSLIQQMRTHKVPIVIRMAEDSGLGTLIEDAGPRQGSFQYLHVFGLLNQTCTTDLLLGGTHEILARELHSVYLSEQSLNRDSFEKRPALVPWEQLPENLKESNRVQADNLGKMLAVCGYRINQLRDWDAGDLEFPPQEVERMARWEHKRWCQEHLEDGWILGPDRNEEKKTNPDLVEWEVLREEEKDKNRRYVRSLPKLLALAGFQIKLY